MTPGTVAAWLGVGWFVVFTIGVIVGFIVSLVTAIRSQWNLKRRGRREG